MIHIISNFSFFIFFKKSVCILYWNEGICGCWNIGNCETNGFKWCLKRKCLERHTFHEVLRIIVSWGMREMTIDIKKMWIIKCLTPYQEEAHVSTRTEDKIHLRSKQFGQKTPAATHSKHKSIIIQYFCCNMSRFQFPQRWLWSCICSLLLYVWSCMYGKLDRNIVQLQVIAEITYCWFPQLDNYADYYCKDSCCNFHY